MSFGDAMAFVRLHARLHVVPGPVLLVSGTKSDKIIRILESGWPRMPFLAADPHSLVNAFFFYHHLCSIHCHYWMSQAYATYGRLRKITVDKPCLCNIKYGFWQAVRFFFYCPMCGFCYPHSPGGKMGSVKNSQSFIIQIFKSCSKHYTPLFPKKTCAFGLTSLLLIAWNIILSEWRLCGAS